MRVFTCVAAGVIALAGSPARATAADPVGELKIGMLQGMFRDVPPDMTQALAKPFRDLMLKQVGYTGTVELLDDPLALADQLKDKKVQLGVFHGFEFAWAQQRCDDLVPLIVTQPPGGKVQAMVVVHKSCPAKSVADLKDDGVHIPRGAKAHSLAFLDKCRCGLNDGTAKPTPRVKQTPEEVLNAVAAGEAKAALVDACVLEGYQTLQPGAFKSLKVLSASEAFPPAVVCYRKGTLSDTEAVRIRKSLASATKTATGKMLMTLWNLKGFEEPPKDYQASLDSILKAYPAPDDRGDQSGGKAADERTTTKVFSPGGRK
jgi:ABC-type phosphate/phosphonate transport system substrate-binding protein